MLTTVRSSGLCTTTLLQCSRTGLSPGGTMASLSNDFPIKPWLLLITPDQYLPALQGSYFLFLAGIGKYTFLPVDMPTNISRVGHWLKHCPPCWQPPQTLPVTTLLWTNCGSQPPSSLNTILSPRKWSVLKLTPSLIQSYINVNSEKI